MENEGPHTDKGSPDPRRASNVVRFPRDWIGPQEELVPLDLPPHDEHLPTPPSANDFWGETSATVQDVLQGSPPRPPPDDCDGHPASLRPLPAEDRDAIAASSRWHGRRRGYAGTLDARARAAVARARAAISGAAPLLAVAAAAVACAIVVIDHFGAANQTGLARSSRHGAGAANVGPRATAATVGIPPALMAWAARQAAGHGVVVGRTRVVRRRHTARTQTTSSAARRQPSSGAGYALPVSSSSYTPQLQSPTPASGGSTTGASGSAPSDAAAAGSTPPAGPVGPGAAFGPGHLG